MSDKVIVEVLDDPSCKTMEIQAEVHYDQGGERQANYVPTTYRPTHRSRSSPLQQVVCSKTTNESDEDEITNYCDNQNIFDNNLQLPRIQHDKTPKTLPLAENDDPTVLRELNNSPASSLENELQVETEIQDAVQSKQLTGNRLIDIGYLFHQLKTMSHCPFECNFSCMEFEKETRVGFMSSFHFKCQMCNVKKVIYSQQPDNKKFINVQCVLSASEHEKYCLLGSEIHIVCNALRNTMPYGHNIYIRKIECCNHLLRNDSNKLRKVVHKTVKKSGAVPVALRKVLNDRIRRLYKAVTRAVEHTAKLNLSPKEKVRYLKEDLRNGPCHVFGWHDACKDYFCKRRDGILEENLVPQLNVCDIWTDIYESLGWVIENTESLLLKETNNPAEHFNSITAKFLASKRVNFSLRGTYEKRCHAAVSEFNIKDYTLLQEIKNKVVQMGIETKYTKKYITKMQHLLSRKRKIRQDEKFKGVKRSKQSKPADEHYGNVANEPDMPNLPKKINHLTSLLN